MKLSLGIGIANAGAAFIRIPPVSEGGGGDPAPEFQRTMFVNHATGNNSTATFNDPNAPWSSGDAALADAVAMYSGDIHLNPVTLYYLHGYDDPSYATVSVPAELAPNLAIRASTGLNNDVLPLHVNFLMGDVNNCQIRVDAHDVDFEWSPNTENAEVYAADFSGTGSVHRVVANGAAGYSPVDAGPDGPSNQGGGNGNPGMDGPYPTPGEPGGSVDVSGGNGYDGLPGGFGRHIRYNLPVYQLDSYGGGGGNGTNGGSAGDNAYGGYGGNGGNFFMADGVNYGDGAAGGPGGDVYAFGGNGGNAGSGGNGGSAHKMDSEVPSITVLNALGGSTGSPGTRGGSPATSLNGGPGGNGGSSEMGNPGPQGNYGQVYYSVGSDGSTGSSGTDGESL